MAQLNRPPALALRFLEWFCPRHLYESIEGDLLEQFEGDLKYRSDRFERSERYWEKRARRRLVWNVIKFLRPDIVFRNKFSIGINQSDMFGNYFKIMLRTMMKRKIYAAINIFSLIIGVTFSMLIGVFIWQELQVNKNIKDVDRLYLLESNNKESENGFPFLSPSPIAKVVKDQYPLLVENYYRFWDRSITVSKDDKHFRVQGMIGDSTFLEMFGFTVLEGDVNSAFEHRHSIIVTEEIARQYFNKTDVVGESLLLATETRGEKEYIVTAVLSDLPRNTVTDFMNMDAKIFLPIQSLEDFGGFDPDVWGGAQMISYVKLAPGASETDVKKAFESIVNKYAPLNVKNNFAMGIVGLKHYHVNANHGAVKKLILTLSAIVFFILALAIINFINITIGFSTIRLKEIGIRKAIGGVRKQMVLQFLSESMALTFVATFLSLVLYEMLRKYFGEALGATLPSVYSLSFTVWKLLFVLMVVTGIVAGSYPAFFLSSHKAIESLKGKLNSIKGSALFSKSLIATQFLFAICVFIFSIIITKQVSFFIDKDLGYDKSYILAVSSVPRLWSEEGIAKMESAKQEFLTTPKVNSVSLSWEIPNGNYGNIADFYKASQSNERTIAMPLLITDENFASTYQLQVMDGKFFHNKDEEWQRERLVINEAAQKALNVTVGDEIKMQNNDIVFRVAGVVKDFNFFSLHQSVKPIVFIHTKNRLLFRYFSFKLQPGNLTQSVEAVEKQWRKIFPNDPFEYAFMDEKLESLYKTELQLKKASSLATVLMLIIVFTGVLGLVSLNVSKRLKEIGIRKVLGATVLNILLLIAKEYAKIIAIAFIIAFPISLYIIHQWLSGFAYRINIQWWMFVLPALIVFAITMAVVSLQSLKAALTNPASTLKYE